MRLRSERDLPGRQDGVYLPMVQCSQCRTTGWISRLVQGSSKLSQLDEIYNTWFAKRPEATRFYAAASIQRSHVDGLLSVCVVACGATAIKGCLSGYLGHQELLEIFHVTAQKTQVRGAGPVHGT